MAQLLQSRLQEIARVADSEHVSENQLRDLIIELHSLKKLLAKSYQDSSSLYITKIIRSVLFNTKEKLEDIVLPYQTPKLVRQDAYCSNTNHREF